MESGFTTTLPAFNRALQRKVQELGRAAPVVIKQEAGALARTLIQLSGPESIAKTRESIKSKAQSTFGTGREGFRQRGGKHGSGDVDWYDWKPTTLRGISRDVDLRDKSAAELYTLFNSHLRDIRTRKGMFAVGRRGKQSVLLWQKFVVNKSAFNAMVKRIDGHIGRRQAGWLKSWRAGGSPQGSVGPVPQRVLRHESGSMGYAIAELNERDPSFTLVNTAVGAGFLKGIVEQAMRLRAKAIAADLLLYWKGVKKL